MKKNIKKVIRSVSRKLTDAEKEFINLKLEKAKLVREKSRLILTSAFLIYIAALVIVLITATQYKVSLTVLEIIILFATVILVISVFPYLMETRKEEREIDEIISELIEEDEFNRLIVNQTVYQLTCKLNKIGNKNNFSKKIQST